MAEAQVAPLTLTEAAPSPGPEAVEPIHSVPSVKPEAASSPAGVISSNKLERLEQTRQTFRLLAAGDPASAMRAAKELKDETERETALLTLVSEWKQGELRSPRERARAIANFGLEAGLAMELSDNPELATLWANELTDGRSRMAVLREMAGSMVASDPATAFAIGDQFPEEARPRFYDALFATWGGKDTDAALRWAEQLADPAQREAALKAIRSSAPVGIGAALTVRDGYPVINQLVPGSPAQLSGQIRAGDRIVGLAQGDNAFVDARGLPLEKIVELVRGAPSTVLQLQVLSSDAPPNAPPRTVALTRDQVKFKQN